jgi:hypothetical protein
MNAILKLWKKPDKRQNSIAQTLNYLFIIYITKLANDDFYVIPLRQVVTFLTVAKHYHLVPRRHLI